MFKTLQKSILFILLLILSCTQIVHAQKKLYQSDGKLPFVEMMLTMMSAMGMVDKVPANGAYGGYGASGLSNPYARALAMRGMSPGLRNSGYGNNPLLRSPWLQTPWSSSALNNSNPNTASPIWGTPSWGVLPLDSYASNYYSTYNPYYQHYPYGSSSPWSASSLDGWVNETWETSLWNPKAEVKAEAPVQTTPAQQVQPNVPLVQNFNYNSPPDATRNVQQNTHQQSGRQSPLSKMAPPNRPPRQRANRPPEQRAQHPSPEAAAQQRNQPPLHTDNRQNIRQKPCVSEFCGLKKPNLNGLWVAENGEMLGVKNTRYLWSDNNSRSLSGQIQVQNEYLLTSVDGHEKILRFKYKLAGNFLLTLKPDGTIREFVRVPINQYYRQ